MMHLRAHQTEIPVGPASDRSEENGKAASVTADRATDPRRIGPGKVHRTSDLVTGCPAVESDSQLGSNSGSQLTARSPDWTFWRSVARYPSSDGISATGGRSGPAASRICSFRKRRAREMLSSEKGASLGPLSSSSNTSAVICWQSSVWLPTKALKALRASSAFAGSTPLMAGSPIALITASYVARWASVRPSAASESAGQSQPLVASKPASSVVRLTNCRRLSG
jgi:hypothetical protein